MTRENPNPRRRTDPRCSGQPVRPRRNTLAAWGLFLFLLAVYHVNGDFTPGNDATPNVFLPVSVLTEGNLSFTVEEVPFMFLARVQTPQGPREVPLQSVDRLRALRARYQVEVRPKYYIVPSVHQGVYVNTFGPGAGLCALPVFAALDMITGDLAGHRKVLWYGGKFVAAAMTAGSAVFVFLIAAGFLKRRRALAVALAYGIGTCVWSTSSQTLWQHGPNEFFLMLGTLLLVRAGRGPGAAALCGLAYSCAVACRPTSVLVVVAVGAFLLVADVRSAVAGRKLRLPRVLGFVLGAMPVALLLAGYNAYYLGSPFTFGQGVAGETIAVFKTQSTELWQTPVWLGAAGLMIGPSRGLLVYSPFMLFAFWGLCLVWWRKTWAVFRPLTIAMLGLMLIAFRWFDWWGGWCFGYRPIVDTMPIFALLLIPAADAIFRRKWLAALAGTMLVWAILVQVLGAFAYNLQGWNAKFIVAYMQFPGQAQPVAVNDVLRAETLRQSGQARLIGQRWLDIDLRENRHRLWSVTDCQIGYYLGNFRTARRLKQLKIEEWVKPPPAVRSR